MPSKVCEPPTSPTSPASPLPNSSKNPKQEFHKGQIVHWTPIGHPDTTMIIHTEGLPCKAILEYLGELKRINYQYNLRHSDTNEIQTLISKPWLSAGDASEDCSRESAKIPSVNNGEIDF
ncbi:hypothetical protein BPAE_0062g00250 [Botrytis paeoniae]|uniref:Uncharacterized protein n=1 Tax=Botrytis paeoniae TaxID=278948 RepID=A0A4Z1FN74_9HELO|nr:hypothetical protein BPAE_0062g00250 [Botrytis paeoniae]